MMFQNLHRMLNTRDGHPLPEGAIASPPPKPARTRKKA